MMISKSSKCLVIGQAPSSKNPTPTGDEQMFKGLCEMDDEVFGLVFERVNLNGQDERTALSLREQLIGQQRHVILLGQEVARCFPLWWKANKDRVNGLRANWVEETDDRGGHIYVHLIPHPSGVVLFWNDPDNVEHAKKVLKEITQQSMALVLRDKIEEQAKHVGTTPEDLAKRLANTWRVDPSLFKTRVELNTVPSPDVRTSLIDEIAAMLRNWIRREAAGETTGLGAILRITAGNPLIVGILTLVGVLLAILLK